MGRIAQNMPLAVNTLHPGRLETELHHLLKKQLYKLEVVTLEYLSAYGLNTLQRGAGEIADLLFQELKCPWKHLPELTYVSGPDQAHEIAVYLPQYLLVNLVKPLHLHHVKQEEQMDSHLLLLASHMRTL